MKAPTHSAAINPVPGKGELVVLFSGNAHTGPLHQAGPQVLEYYLVHTVLSGKGSFRCLGKEYQLSKGDHFFIFPGGPIAQSARHYSLPPDRAYGEQS